MDIAEASGLFGTKQRTGRMLGSQQTATGQGGKHQGSGESHTTEVVFCAVYEF